MTSARGRVARRRLSAAGRVDGVQPLLGRRGHKEDFVGERDVKGALELVAQLDEGEAVDAEVVGRACSAS